jgi:hypothetical protein
MFGKLFAKILALRGKVQEGTCLSSNAKVVEIGTRAVPTGVRTSQKRLLVLLFVGMVLSSCHEQLDFGIVWDEQALIAAVNHAGDSDSTGAITGNILGAAIGYDAIPQKFKDDLELHDVILHMADDLYRGEVTKMY